MTQNRSTDKEAPMKTDRESVERLLTKMTFEVVNSEMNKGFATELGTTLRALLAENEALTRSGIAEVAARNPNVMEYMRHWEARAEAAEAKLAHEDAAIDRDDLSPVERAVLAMWGDRCPEHADGCSTCGAWAEIDRMRAAEARLEAVARSALERAVDCAAEADSYELATYGEGKIVARIRALDPAQIVREATND